MNQKPLSFAPGDVIRVPHSSTGEPLEAIIILAEIREGGDVQYSTTRGAWYEHDKAELIHKANTHSLAAAAQSLRDEDAADEDYVDDDDSDVFG